MNKFILLIFAMISFANAGDINFDTLVDKAKKEKKHILVFFHSPSCGYCEKMIDFTLDADSVSSKIKNDFIYVDIGIKDSGEILFDDFKGSKREFARYLDYDIYPSTVFIDQNGKMIYAQAGYQNEEYFLKILSYISTASYKEMGIEDFKGSK